uniref:PIR2-like helical domain-containing protein n=1 Tax=Oryza rufipogon TaxID=4529 RepID=A0A0E0R336_ORYRU
MKRRKIPNRQRRSSSLGRFTCYHGGGDDDNRCNHTWYDEAARRLPLDDIPELADCLGEAGCCLGLADPVTNIILTTILITITTYSRKKSYGFSMSHTSFRGLLAFLKLYFPYVTDHQARRYLHIASSPSTSSATTAAISLKHCCSPSPTAALRIAAVQADHPAPDDPTTSSNAPTTCSPPMTSGPSRIYSTPANGRRPTPTSCAANNATCIGGGAFARISIQIMGKYNLSSNSGTSPT